MIRFLDRSLRAEVYQEPGFLSKLILLWNRRKTRPFKIPATDSLLEMIQAETRKLLQKDLGLAESLAAGGNNINGVAYTLQQHARIACENSKQLTVITCNRNGASAPGVINFEPLGQYELPEYPERRQKMGRAARAYMEQRSFDAAFLKTWEMYTAAETGLKGPHHWPDQVANL